jgi:hypothetical protein
LFRFFEIAIFSHDLPALFVMAIIGNQGEIKTANRAVFTAYFTISARAAAQQGACARIFSDFDDSKQLISLALVLQCVKTHHFAHRNAAAVGIKSSLG